MIDYKGIRIAKDTTAYKLWEAKEFGKLDDWLKVLEAKRKKLEG